MNLLLKIILWHSGFLVLFALWFAYEMSVAPLGEEDENGYGPINPRDRRNP